MSSTSSTSSSISSSSSSQQKSTIYDQLVDCDRCFSKRPINEANGPDCSGCEEMYEREYTRVSKSYQHEENKQTNPYKLNK